MMCYQLLFTVYTVAKGMVDSCSVGYVAYTHYCPWNNITSEKHNRLSLIKWPLFLAIVVSFCFVENLRLNVTLTVYPLMM